MSDSIDVVSGGMFNGGLPVYTVVKEATERAAKKWGGMNDEQAKKTGTAVGATVSVLTTLFGGTP